MNSTIVPTLNTTATITYSLDQIVFFLQLQIPSFVRQFYLWGFLVTFLLGFVGNTASVLTFSRPKLIKVSTGCLFIVLAISDLFYLFIAVFDFIEYGLKIDLYGKVAYNELCRFRSFVSSMAQLCSAWVLVVISIDRWIRTRFPYKAGYVCTPKKMLMVVAILLVLDVSFNSQMLISSFGELLPGVASSSCGPRILVDQNYAQFYFFGWIFVQLAMSTLIPTVLMLLILIDIVIVVYVRKQTVVQQSQQNKRMQKQMFILMLSSIVVFFVTNMPPVVNRIVASQQSTLDSLSGASVGSITILTWIQSLNYAINFYLHCLSSTLFRREFKRLMTGIRGSRVTPVMTFTQTNVRHQMDTHV